MHWVSQSLGASSNGGAPRVDAHGFAADWRVLKINRDYPQVWTDDNVAPARFAKSAFGVDFYQPVDAYQRNYRAIHYAILFIALTFMALFLWEHIAGPRIHAVQYAMTGAALAVFYLVLLALSEHMTFAGSYFIASGALAALLAVYFAGVRRSRAAGLATGAVAGLCYSLLYLLVLSEEYALLLGALAVFALLAGTMIGTRRLDWYRLADGRREGS